jgi:hypothetical protein
VDAIVETPPAPMADAGRAETSEPSPTDDEQLIHAMLSAMGNIEVRSKAEFSRAVNAWLAHKVTGLHPDRPEAGARLERPACVPCERSFG